MVRWSDGRRSATSSTITSPSAAATSATPCGRPGGDAAYATEILGQSLVILWTYGAEHALVTCDDDNIGSAAVIEACGGVLERIVAAEETDDGVAFRRYWIGR